MKGNVVVYVLTKLYTKEYILTQLPIPLSGQLEWGGVREEGWGVRGPNQLTRSNTHNTVHFCSDTVTFLWRTRGGKKNMSCWVRNLFERCLRAHTLDVPLPPILLAGFLVVTLS
jgi:hypothetical protein